MQTPLRALVHFLTVGWKKHMPSVKKHTKWICSVEAFFFNSLKKQMYIYVQIKVQFNILHFIVKSYLIPFSMFSRGHLPLNTVSLKFTFVMSVIL